MAADARTNDSEPSAFSRAEIGRTEGRYLLAVRRLAGTTPDRITTDGFWA